jgi:hypothetical protein
VKVGAAVEPPQRGCIHVFGGWVDLELEDVPQATNTGAFERLRKHGLRIEPGDKGLRADDVRDRAGGDTNGTVRPEGNAEPCERGQPSVTTATTIHFQTATQFSGVWLAAYLARGLRRANRGQRLHRHARRRHVILGTKKSDISGAERSTR